MPPRMRTQSDGRPAAVSQGGEIGGRAGRGGGRTGGRSGDQGSGKIDGQGGQGSEATKVEVTRMVGIKTVMPSMTTSGVMLGMSLRKMTIRTLGREVAIGISWDNFKLLMMEEFCLSNEMQKLETELWNHTMVGADHAAYTDRFYELARLVLHLVTPKNRKIEMYVYGLAPQIRGMVTATEPSTIQKAVQIAGTLTNEALR
ncbi:reverse transcriptase domain-containing protein, partial [Tanacetum coccineum]